MGEERFLSRFVMDGVEHETQARMRVPASEIAQSPIVVLVHGTSGTIDDMADPATHPGMNYDLQADRSSDTIDLGWQPIPILGVYAVSADQMGSVTGWEGFLNQSGFRTVNYAQAAPTDHLGKDREQLVCLLRDLIAHYPDRDFALVGHSRGGVLARAAVVEARDAHRFDVSRIKQLITLHSPNQGSSLANIGVFVNALNEAVKLTVGKDAEDLLRPLYTFLKGQTGKEAYQDYQVGSDLLRDLAAREPVQGIQYYTFGGTSSVLLRLWPWVITVDSFEIQRLFNNPFHCKAYPGKPSGVPSPEVLTVLGQLPPGLRAEIAPGVKAQVPPELLPGVGDFLVTDEAARLPFAPHRSNAINHAEALWDPTLQQQVAAVLKRTWAGAAGDDALPNEELAVNQAICSANGLYSFVFQSDGNLVLYKNYRNAPRRILWASGTGGPVGYCIMQGDGNLVIYNGNDQAVWSSGTWQHPGSRLLVQNDGNVVIYRPDGSAVWATHTVQPALPAAPAATGEDAQPGEALAINQPVRSANGRYSFIFQGDGNLVLYKHYRNGAQRALWSSGTGGPVGVCIMQGDGNLVIYDGDVRPVWSSGTYQHPGSRLIVQNDGNVVIYRPDGKAVWATRTVQPELPTGPAATGDTAQPGQVLAIDQPIRSADGRYSLVFQGDGNLVLYTTRGGGRPLWATNTGGPVGVCIMQGDGNLVIYDGDACPVWSSGTYQHPGSRLVVQNDGNVVIYRPDGTAPWATKTVLPELHSGPAATGDTMQPGQVLPVDQPLRSASGEFSLIFQGDGNLVLYKWPEGRPLWASNTRGPVGVCIMQPDGNLVVYDDYGRAVWSSDTHQYPGSALVVQNDGNLVIYRPGAIPVWATNTHSSV